MVLESQKVSGCSVAYRVSVNLLSNSLKHWWETSPNCSSVIRNAWHFYYALGLVVKVVCGGIGIALRTYMVSPCFASQ